MAESPEEELKYSPKLNVKVVNQNGVVEGNIDIPVPDGQEWLYAMLEKQQKSLRRISSWMTFFGILFILSIIAVVAWTIYVNI
jgi:hypothetical protein